MRAYAVFAGGGAKGAAHAGALHATQRAGIEFVGYGGTSAGSIVALLAAVGYSGYLIGETFTKTEFRDFFPDRGEALEKCQKHLEVLEKSNNNLIGKVRKAWAINCILKHLGDQFGLYATDELKNVLRRLVCERLHEIGSPEARRIAAQEKISFGDLLSLGCPPLKVVASDVNRQRPVLFPRDMGSNFCVIDAVAASCSYPFVFKPVKSQGGTMLVDGGLSSNLPAALFSAEIGFTRLYTLAFDIDDHENDGVVGYYDGLVDYAKQLAYTALSASDVMMRDEAYHVLHVPIRIPSSVGTMSLDTETGTKLSLINAGYACATEALREWGIFREARTVNFELKSSLEAQFGPTILYDPILQALTRDIEESSYAQDVRAHVMLVTGRGTRIVVFQYGMDDDTDVAFEMAENAGCSGFAWETGVPMIADLVEARNYPESWGMTKDEHRLVPAHRKSMMSVAIPGRKGEFEGPPGSKRIGTLSVDSSTPLADTGWKGDQGIKADLVQIMTLWASVIARVMP